MKKILHFHKYNPHNNPRRPLLLIAFDREESRGSGRLHDLLRKCEAEPHSVLSASTGEALFATI